MRQLGTRLTNLRACNCVFTMSAHMRVPYKLGGRTCTISGVCTKYDSHERTRRRKQGTTNLHQVQARRKHLARSDPKENDADFWAFVRSEQKGVSCTTYLLVCRYVQNSVHGRISGVEGISGRDSGADALWGESARAPGAVPTQFIPRSWYNGSAMFLERTFKHDIDLILTI